MVHAPGLLVHAVAEHDAQRVEVRVEEVREVLLVVPAHFNDDLEKHERGFLTTRTYVEHL